MKKINLKKKLKRYRAQTQYTFGFYSIIFPLFLISIGILFFLEKNGLSVSRLRNPLFLIIGISFLCIIIGFSVSLILMNMIFEPMEKLSEASKEVAKGNYNTQLKYDGYIEQLESTFHNFNFMVRELNSVEIMRNDFIANVSHEFKTPLSSISGYATLLQDPELSEKERNEYIQMIRFNIDKLNDLTGNILQLSKLENQNTMNDPVTYRLDEQIREAIVLLEPKWNQKQISLEIDIPDVSYTGQQALLFQVWMNLISNAIKFSDQKGAITIKLKSIQSEISVLISDNGIGMSEDTISHIFEKFYQCDTSRQSQGNGLGLPLCKKILDKCGGKIYVSSELGKGSTFMVILPKTESRD